MSDKEKRYETIINTKIVRNHKMKFTCNDEKFLQEFNLMLIKFLQDYNGEIVID